MMRVSGKEREVELKRMFWSEQDRVMANPKWDANEQIDFLVVRLNGKWLKRSIAIQLTFRRKSLAKLERFVHFLPNTRFKRVLYLEVDDRCSIRQLRETMIRLLPGLDARFGRCMQVYASIDRFGKIAKLMTVQDALEDMRQHYAKQVAVSGTIVERIHKGFLIHDEHRNEYRFLDREIVDKEFLHAMHSNERGESGMIGSMVRGTWLLTSNQVGVIKWLYYVTADRRH